MILTISLCSIIVIVFLIFLYLIRKWENDVNEVLFQHKRIIEYFPSIVSTLGVLGTFFGITIGLIGFDTTDLNASIPKLLEGLKTAFFTSLLGMLGSIVLSSRVNRLFDKNGSSDAETAAARIVAAVESMSRVNNKNIEALSNKINDQTESQNIYHRTVSNNFDIIKQSDAALALVLEKLSKELNGFSGKVDKLNKSIQTMVDLQRSQETAVATMKVNMDKITTVQENATKTINESSSKLVESMNKVEEGSTNQMAAITAIAAQTVGVAQIANDVDDIHNINSSIGSAQNHAIERIESIEQKIERLLSVYEIIIELQRNQESAITNVKGNTDSIVQSLGNVEEHSSTQMASLVTIAAQTVAISKIGDDVSEILDINGAMSGVQDEIATEVKTFGEKLHAEVVEIEDSMDKTNKLLSEKFDEFSDLLKKSNTEALVEVMKKVTEEFEKQMSTLINKLIQENFDQLNKSVERLNTWQQENKEMIDSLTKQYKEMSTNFEATSTSLTKVKDDTRMLVSDGGKLRQLIDSLNKVIVEDEKFIKLTTDLQTTANLSKDNMEKFDKATSELNNWVRKQRNFVDAVQVLLGKLEDIGKIKDYNEQFWQGTKKQMEDGVGIIKRSTDTLNKQLTEIDRRFYARLSTTLAELDACITSLVKQNR